MTWADQSRFEGEWKNDRRYFGRMTMIDGSEYIGHFEGIGNSYGGYGTLKLIDGTIFSGIFVDGACPKIGRVKLEQGEVYEGEVADYKPEGLGKAVSTEGDIYIGNWSGGRKNGFG